MKKPLSNLKHDQPHTSDNFADLIVAYELFARCYTLGYTPLNLPTRTTRETIVTDTHKQQSSGNTAGP